MSYEDRAVGEETELPTFPPLTPLPLLRDIDLRDIALSPIEADHAVVEPSPIRAEAWRTLLYPRQTQPPEAIGTHRPRSIGTLTKRIERS